MSFKRMFQAVETHSGEPMRVVTGGVPHIPGNNDLGGQSWIYGYSTYVLDPTDPFANGFKVGDIWA